MLPRVVAIGQVQTEHRCIECIVFENLQGQTRDRILNSCSESGDSPILWARPQGIDIKSVSSGHSEARKLTIVQKKASLGSTDGWVRTVPSLLVGGA